MLLSVRKEGLVFLCLNDAVSLAREQHTKVVALIDRLRVGVIRQTTSLTIVLASLLIRQVYISRSHSHTAQPQTTTEDLGHMSQGLLTRLVSTAGAARPRPARRRLRAMVERILADCMGDSGLE